MTGFKLDNVCEVSQNKQAITIYAGENKQPILFLYPKEAGKISRRGHQAMNRGRNFKQYNFLKLPCFSVRHPVYFVLHKFFWWKISLIYYFREMWTVKQFQMPLRQNINSTSSAVLFSIFLEINFPSFIGKIKSVRHHRQFNKRTSSLRHRDYLRILKKVLGFLPRDFDSTNYWNCSGYWRRGYFMDYKF